MRKILSWKTAFVLLFTMLQLTACTNEEILPFEPMPSTPTVVKQKLTLLATSEEHESAETRTALSDALKVIWSDGDSLAIVNPSEMAIMKLSGGAGTSNGQFAVVEETSLQVSDQTFAIYPESAFQNYTNGEVTLTIPAQQDYAENSFGNKANPMIGKLIGSGNSHQTAFKNMMGVLKLSLTGNYDFVTKITITDAGNKNVWGTARISPDTYADGIANALEGGTSTLTLNCPFVKLTSTATPFYFVVPKGSFESGFQVDIYVNGSDTPAETISTTRNNVISRNKIKIMPEKGVEIEVETFDIENGVTKTYLDKGPYSKWGADSYFLNNNILTSWIDPLSSFGKTATDQDYPLAKTISWTSANDCQLTFRDETTGKNIFENRTVKNKYDLVNMTPGHIYTYEVRDNGKIIMANKFQATGRMRWIQVDDTWNFRDMGGWESSELGGTVQYGLLYRCGSLNGQWKKEKKQYSSSELGDKSNYDFFSTSSTQQLIDLGITGELDLRALYSEDPSTKTEYSHKYAIGESHTYVPGWEYKQIMNNPIQSDNPLETNVLIDDMEWIIERVLADKPVAFHCKSGADRTGILAYLIYSLLGVSEGDIALEFELTNMSHEQKIVKGSSELRGKYTSKVGEKFYTNSFTTLGRGSRQKNAYYYLTEYTNNNKTKIISTTDLNTFIAKMLGMESYTQQ